MRRTRPGDTAPAVHGPARLPAQAPGRVQEGQALGDLEAHPLEAPDLLAEGLAAGGVAGGHLQRRPSHPDGAAGARHALGDHHLVEDFGALADARLTPEDVLQGHFHVPEDDPSRPAAPGAHEAVDVFHGHARTPLHEKGRDGVAGLGVLAGLCVDQKQIGALGTHDETFLAVEEEPVALPLGPCRRPEEVRAAPRLREGLRGRQPSRDEGARYFSFWPSVPKWAMASPTMLTRE